MKLDQVLNSLGFTTDEKKIAFTNLLNFKGYFGEEYQQIELTEHDIFTLLNIDKSSSLEGMQNELNQFLQRDFKRPAGLENAVIEDIKVDEDRNYIIQQLKVLGYIDGLQPSFNDKLPLVIFVQGAEERIMKERLKSLEDSINNNSIKGENIKLIIPMSSDRPVWPIHEASTIPILMAQASENVTPKMIGEVISKHFTEEIIKGRNFPVLLQARANCIEELKQIGIKWPTEEEIFDKLVKEFANKATQEENKEEALLVRKSIIATSDIGERPTIDHCIKALEKDEKLITEIEKLGKFNVLLISSQPVGAYQKNVYSSYIGKQFESEARQTEVLAKTWDTPNANVGLDSVARYVYSGLKCGLFKEPTLYFSTNYQQLVSPKTFGAESRLGL